MLGLAGCGDNMAAVQRDFFNLKHEVLDNLSNVSDEASALRFNKMYSGRLKEKETANKERFDKIKNNQFTQKDRDALDLELKLLHETTLKGQRTSAQTRLLQELNRIRRNIVRMAEEQAVIAKQQNQSFSISAKKNWPNLCGIEALGDFATVNDSPAGGGGGGGMMMMMGGPPGMGPMGPPGQGAKGGAAPAEAKLDPKAFQNFDYVIECRKTDDPGRPWDESRSWRAGATVIDRLEINGIDLAPRTP